MEKFKYMSENSMIINTGEEVKMASQGGYPEIIKNSVGLSPKDQEQLKIAYDSKLYDMATVFIWNKTIMALKYQLGKLGMPFIAELLDRPEIDSNSNYQDISNEDALRLAEDLGFISSSGSFRLRSAGELVKHFSSPEIQEEEEMASDDVVIQPEEAMMVLRTCVQYVLFKKNVEISVDFKAFRDSLITDSISINDESVQKLSLGQYFYKRTALRIILGLIRTSEGAQLENVLANANVIIPHFWADFSKQERYQVGRNYADMINNGRQVAASGLKQVLLKVRGFDYVPEDLRSTAFSKAADAILDAHYGINNFYTESLPVNNLYRMGTVIPISVFAKCITAVLCVKLGNSYGWSYGAENAATSLLDKVSMERWLFYFQECFMYDEKILYKLQQCSIALRWINVMKCYDLISLKDQVVNPDVQKLIVATYGGNHEAVMRYAERLYKSMGYGK